MTTTEAINHLSNELLNDASYYYTWQKELAIAFENTFFENHKKLGVNEISHIAAKRFLRMLITGIETPTAEKL